MRKIVSILLIFILIISTGGCQNESLSKMGGTITPTNSSILENIYYENDDHAFFYSSIVEDIINNDFDYYSLYWLLSIDALTVIDVKNDLMAMLNDSLINGSICDSTKYKYDGVFDIYLRSGIESFLGRTDNKSTYLSQLYEYYDSNQGLFAIDTDNITEAIQQTNIALKTLVSLNSCPDYVNEIQSKLLDLCNNDTDTFFPSDIDLKRDLISAGIVIIDNLRLADSLLKTTDVGNLGHLETWVKKVGSVYESYVTAVSSYDPIVFQGRQTLMNILSYMNLDIRIPEVPVLELIPLFIRDCQMAFQYISSVGKEELSENEINYLSQNYKYHLYINKPSYSIRDIYFGVKLYSIAELPFSREKILLFIDSFISKGEMSADDIFYIVNIYEELGVSSDSIKLFINEWGGLIDIQNTKEHMESAYQILYISKNYDYELDDALKNSYIKSASYYLSSSDNFSQVYYSYKLLKLMNQKIEMGPLFGSIGRFEQTNGYKASLSNDAVSMYSLFRIYTIYVDEKDLNANYKEDVLAYLNELRSPSGGFFIFNDGVTENMSYDINFSLQAYYYGLVMESECSR